MTVGITQLLHPAEVDEAMRVALTDCWVEVTNAGGAVGFPFPPVSTDEVRPALDALVNSLDPARVRLLIATFDGELAGWVAIERNFARLVEHWATVRRLQTATAYRGNGVGTALMTAVRDVARDEMGLAHLWISVRAGMALEAFYLRLGWIETGRHPKALQVAEGDVRDEVFMALLNL